MNTNETKPETVRNIAARTWHVTGADSRDRALLRAIEKDLCELADRIELALAAQPAPVSVPDGFYLASFKHKDRGGAMMWWGPGNAGYTIDIEQAGIYTEITPGYHDSDDTVPVPVSFLGGCRIRRTLDLRDSKNRAFWSAADLRAALTAALNPEGRSDG